MELGVAKRILEEGVEEKKLKVAFIGGWGGVEKSKVENRRIALGFGVGGGTPDDFTEECHYSVVCRLARRAWIVMGAHILGGKELTQRRLKKLQRHTRAREW